jgi:CrcB protein
MERALLVGLGGFVGSVGRYWVAGQVQSWASSDVPLGTLAVNAAGSLLLGFVLTLSVDRGLLGPELRLLLAVGVCGGFTTMSTFSFETLALFQQGSFVLAAWNAAGTLLVCLAAVWLGATAGRLI